MEASITLKSLAKKYNNCVVLADLSLGIERNSNHALIGQNGSGKSTILKVLVGLIEKDAGIAYINGKDISSRGIETRMVTGYMPQTIDFDPEINIYENLLFFAQLYGLSTTRAQKEIIKYAEVFDFKADLDKHPEVISKGTLRTMQLTRAIIHNPEILLLDEPTLEMDQSNKIKVWDLLEKIGKNKTILFVSQDFNEVEKFADRISILHKGDIKMDGSLERLASTTKGLSKYEIRFNDIQPIELLDEIKKMPKILKPQFHGNSLEFYSYEKREFFHVLRKVIDREVSDIDIGFCKIMDLYLGLINNGME